MKIERIDAYVVKLPRSQSPETGPDYGRPGQPLAYETVPQFGDMIARRYSEALFVKVTSDTGLVGWGEGQSL